MSQLQSSYLPIENFLQDAKCHQAGLLGALYFSRSESIGGNAPEDVPPRIQVPMAYLDPAGRSVAACEAWHTGGELTYGVRAGVHYSHNEAILFGTIQLSETEFDTPDARASGKTPLRMASEFAYRSIFELAQALGFPAVFRFWNYLADINGNTHGMERYRQFNMGRQDGFLARGQTVAESVPSASAVGFESGPLTVCFLAGRAAAAPVFVENPRQVSAYRYPAEYGPCSPTFSRANVVRLGGDAVLFLSGTASIVGHQTLHKGDVIAQTHETLANIDAVIAEARRLTDVNFPRENLCCKVYLRHAEHLAPVRDELHRALGPSAKLLFLRADICRRDLLIEIEATAGHPLVFAVPSR